MWDAATSTFTLAASDLDALTNSITANVGVILPVGVTAMAILAGVSLVPKIFYRFF